MDTNKCPNCDKLISALDLMLDDLEYNLPFCISCYVPDGDDE